MPIPPGELPHTGVGSVALASSGVLNLVLLGFPVLVAAATACWRRQPAA